MRSAMWLLISAAAAAAAESDYTFSVCTDMDKSCAAWSQKGDCTNKKTMEHVRKTCPQSCGVCEPNCEDEDALKCPEFAALGECMKNPDFMIHKCKMSCGYCSPICKDTHYLCGEWAKQDKCLSDHDYMMRACPVSCGTCFSTCADRKSDCPRWALEGQCGSNPGFMFINCPHSCDVCKEESGTSTKAEASCADFNATQCELWNSSGECLKNPLSVIPQCPKTCKACSTICHDKKAECTDWAKKGECVGKNSKAMDIDCPSSCGLCAKLFDKFHLEMAYDQFGHDEL